MAKTKKTTRKSNKKAQTRKNPQSFTVRSLKKTKENWLEMVKDYNEKYVFGPFDTGKDFVEDMRKDPRKVLGNLVDDGKGFVADVRKDPRKVFNDLYDEGKGFVDGVLEDLRKGMDDLAGDGKDLYKGLEKDTRKMFNGLADSGKRFMDRVPLMQTIGDKIADGMEAVPARLNLPSKKDIDSLTSTMKTLNRKVAALSRQ